MVILEVKMVLVESPNILASHSYILTGLSQRLRYSILLSTPSWKLMGIICTTTTTDAP